jgi:hypothetical protein
MTSLAAIHERQARRVAIIEALRSGEGQRSVARRFGAPPSTVWSIAQSIGIPGRPEAPIERPLPPRAFCCGNCFYLPASGCESELGEQLPRVARDGDEVCAAWRVRRA